MEKITLIIAIITSILSLGLFGVIKSFVKELKELIDYYNQAKKDGFTDEERIRLSDELFDVMREGLKFYNIIMKAIGKIKRKK